MQADDNSLIRSISSHHHHHQKEVRDWRRSTCREGFKMLEGVGILRANVENGYGILLKSIFSQLHLFLLLYKPL
jgi:hypothetical protein